MTDEQWDDSQVPVHRTHFEPTVTFLDHLARIEDCLTKNTGGFGMSFTDDGEWVGSLEWGKEAPDSDMVGAAAYAQGSTFAEVVAELVSQAGLPSLVPTDADALDEMSGLQYPDTSQQPPVPGHDSAFRATD